MTELQKVYSQVDVLDYGDGDVMRFYRRFAADSYSFVYEFNNAATKAIPPRYSLVGLSALAKIVLKNNKLVYCHGNDVIFEQQFDCVTQAWAKLEALTANAEFVLNPEIELFEFGWLGIWGYESIRYFEPHKLPAPELPDLTQSSDVELMLPQQLVIFDHKEKRAKLVTFSSDAQHCDTGLIERLHAWPQDSVDGPVQFNFKQDEFKQTVDKLKQNIKDGEIMQAVLSQRMQIPVSGCGLDFFTQLRRVSPSPYQFYIRLNNGCLFGASPETLVRNDNGELVSFPMAGTRHRQACEIENAQLEQELLQDEKELAEHLMLIDLARNDLGRVSNPATVSVPRKMTVEHFSHVMHITSQVSASLNKQHSNFDLIKATLPAGTLSGAPKIRAMQLLDKYEQVRRGFYGGGVGLLNNQLLDLAIIIRSAYIKNGYLNIQAGAGIVTDSNPESEWQETMNKSRAMLVALGIAEPQDKEAATC